MKSVNEINKKNKDRINKKMKTRRTDEFIKFIPGFVVASVLLLPQIISHEESFWSDVLPLVFLLLTEIIYCYFVGLNEKFYENHRIIKKNKRKGREINIKDYGVTFIDESVGRVAVKSIVAIILLLAIAIICSIKHISLSTSDTVAILSIFFTTIFFELIWQDGIRKGISDLRNVLKYKKNKSVFSNVIELLKNVIFVGLIIFSTIYSINEAITDYISLIELFI
ncbi:hypothetical protein [Acetobacterium woodii]|uniref:Putative transmembrane protein n=1 Tax=Acetobacterium woodii (strain ATCC 29683 / DSM 1030 / JCM 2381 / KCTC 1655 / WB1) TaxID=931626 RepID=H6LHS2_ACEWD|nr:hypothetical protein [Acetobacterium woodii]AFA47251.1 putative transmembrane protein [Acetobacterium woodii DSM 1030]